MISIVVAVLATGGAAAGLWHVGRDLRQHKRHDRSLDFAGLRIGGRLTVLGAVALVCLVAAGAFYRVYSEGIFSGRPQLAVLLALLVGVVMLLSASLTCGVAFRDGSPIGDDLHYYSKLVNSRLEVRRAFEQQADECQREIEKLEARGATGPGPVRVDVVGRSRDNDPSVEVAGATTPAIGSDDRMTRSILSQSSTTT